MTRTFVTATIAGIFYMTGAAAQEATKYEQLTDVEIAEMLREAEDRMNALVLVAVNRGLLVSMNVTEHLAPGRELPVVEINVASPL